MQLNRITWDGMLSLHLSQQPYPRRRPGPRTAWINWSFDPMQPQYAVVVERRRPGVRLRYVIWQN
ncbi:MAG: hypothetical protein KDJ97_22500 [Anaerolineae bacterium]|nr:hypothetical protein [Anaerolineae bacterium]